MSDLLKQLRHESDIFRKGGANGRADLIGNAADLIEKLQARVVELEGEVHNKASAYNQLCDKYCEIESERDALAAQAAKSERKAKKHMQIDMGNREVIDMQKQALSDAQSEIDALAAHVEQLQQAGRQ